MPMIVRIRRNDRAERMLNMRGTVEANQNGLLGCAVTLARRCARLAEASAECRANRIWHIRSATQQMSDLPALHR